MNVVTEHYSIPRDTLDELLLHAPAGLHDRARREATPMLSCLTYEPGNVATWLAPLGIDGLDAQDQTKIISEVMDEIEHEVIADTIGEVARQYVEDNFELNDSGQLRPVDDAVDMDKFERAVGEIPVGTDPQEA